MHLSTSLPQNTSRCHRCLHGEKKVEKGAGFQQDEGMHRLYRCFGGFAGSDAPTATPRELRKRKNWLLTYGCVLWVMRVRVLPRGPSGWQPQGGICAVIASAEFGVWRGAGWWLPDPCRWHDDDRNGFRWSEFPSAKRLSW